MNLIQVNLIKLWCVLAFALFPCALALGSTPIVVKTIDQVVSSPRLYDGKKVRVDACVFVSRHGMALDNCNWRPRQAARLLSFEPYDSQNDKAYQRLVRARFASRYKDIVLVTVTGEFQFNRANQSTYLLKITDVTNLRTIRDPEL